MRRNWVVSGWETRRHRWAVVEEVFQRVGQGVELVTLTQHSNTRRQGWSDTISLTQAQSHIQSVHPSLHIMAFYLLIPSRPHLSCWDIQTSTVATEFWHFPPIGCNRVPCQKKFRVSALSYRFWWHCHRHCCRPACQTPGPGRSRQPMSKGAKN